MVKEQQGYNVFALHSVWDRREMEKGLGTTTAKFVTILRDPVAEFESLYSYSHFDKVFNMNLETFVHTYIGGRKPVQRVREHSLNIKCQKRCILQTDDKRLLLNYFTNQYNTRINVKVWFLRSLVIWAGTSSCGI